MENGKKGVLDRGTSILEILCGSMGGRGRALGVYMGECLGKSLEREVRPNHEGLPVPA